MCGVVWGVECMCGMVLGVLWCSVVWCRLVCVADYGLRQVRKDITFTQTRPAQARLKYLSPQSHTNSWKINGEHRFKVLYGEHQFRGCHCHLPYSLARLCGHF